MSVGTRTDELVNYMRATATTEIPSPVLSSDAEDRCTSADYARIVRLAGSLLAAFDWTQLLLCVTRAFSELPEVHARIWALRQNNFVEIASSPSDVVFAAPAPDVLISAGSAAEACRDPDGVVFAPLRSVGVLPMLLELHGLGDVDLAFVDEAARVIASRAAYLELADPNAGVMPALLGTEEVARAMHSFSAALQPLLAHDRITIFLLTAGDRAIERFAVVGATPAPEEEVITPISEFGLRECILRNQAQLTEDIVRERAPHSRGARILGHAGFRSALSVPLRLNGQCIGIMQLLSRSTGFYQEHDVQIAQDVADHTAAFIDHMRRQESVRPAALREAIETERTRLSCDIGVVAQVTFAQAEQALSRLMDRPGYEDPDALLALDTIRAARSEIGAAVAGIIPAPLRSRTFEQIIRESVAKASLLYRLPIEVVMSGDLAAASMTARRMTNGVLVAALAAAHAANATKAVVSITVEDDVLLNVTDDGPPGQRHLDIEAAAPAELQTIAECAHALGGRVYTEHHTGRGTTLILELPRVQAVRRDLEDERWRAAVPEERAPARSLRLYVLDQQGVRRAGFTHFLDAQQELRVVGHAATIAQARRSVGWLQPDVVFVDAEETTAAVTVREVRQASASSIVIGLASRTARVSAEELTAAGAAGVLPHDLEREELRDAIIRLVRGDDLQTQATPANPTVPVGSILNSREWAVLKLIVAGRTNAEIGAELFLAPKTIERHVATITHKIGARNRAHLVAVAIGRGLVRPPAD